jgi:hypothetical protein
MLNIYPTAGVARYKIIHSFEGIRIVVIVYASIPYHSVEI